MLIIGKSLKKMHYIENCDKILLYSVFLEAVMADDFSFEIVKSLGTVAETKGGWKLELNLVSWGGRPAKYDLRSWSPDHEKMGKGSTFSKEELEALKNLLNNLELE